MHFDDQVGARSETPRQALREQRSDLTRRPAEKMAVGVDGGVREQSVVPRSRVLFVERARGRRAIDPDVGMMHDLRIARPEFHTPDVAHALDWNRQHEHARNIGALRREHIRLRQRDDEIGYAELPSVRPSGRRRQVRGFAFRRAVLEPSLQDTDLAVGERTMPDELAVARLRFPRRHHARSRHRRNLRRVRSGCRIREQAERGGSVRVMADCAPLEDDRRDVSGKRDRTGRRRLEAAGRQR